METIVVGRDGGVLTWPEGPPEDARRDLEEEFRATARRDEMRREPWMWTGPMSPETKLRNVADSLVGYVDSRRHRGRAEAISATAKQLRDMLHEYLDWVEGPDKRRAPHGERPEIPATDTLPF